MGPVLIVHQRRVIFCKWRVRSVKKDLGEDRRAGGRMLEDFMDGFNGPHLFFGFAGDRGCFTLVRAYWNAERRGATSGG